MLNHFNSKKSWVRSFENTGHVKHFSYQWLWCARSRTWNSKKYLKSQGSSCQLTSTHLLIGTLRDQASRRIRKCLWSLLFQENVCSVTDNLVMGSVVYIDNDDMSVVVVNVTRKKDRQDQQLEEWDMLRTSPRKDLNFDSEFRCDVVTARKEKPSTSMTNKEIMWLRTHVWSNT